MHSLRDLVFKSAARFELRANVLAALIWVESRGDAWAVRYEDGFYRQYLASKPRDALNGYVPRKIPTLSTEKRLRACSFGVCQVMGETARGMGFDYDNLSLMFKPEYNIHYGAKYLAQGVEKFGNCDEGYRKALLRYNGGGNKQYDDYVFGAIDAGKHEDILK